MKQNVPQLIWDENHEAITHIDRLKVLLENLHQEGGMTTPFDVTLKMNNETYLSAVLGGNYSHLEYMSYGQEGLIQSCIDKEKNNHGTFVFLYNGDFSEIELTYCVDVNIAFLALYEYYTTGERPKIVDWTSY